MSFDDSLEIVLEEFIENINKSEELCDSLELTEEEIAIFELLGDKDAGDDENNIEIECLSR